MADGCGSGRERLSRLRPCQVSPPHRRPKARRRRHARTADHTLPHFAQETAPLVLASARRQRPSCALAPPRVSCGPSVDNRDRPWARWPSCWATRRATLSGARYLLGPAQPAPNDWRPCPGISLSHSPHCEATPVPSEYDPYTWTYTQNPHTYACTCPVGPVSLPSPLSRAPALYILQVRRVNSETARLSSSSIRRNPACL